MQQLLAQPVVLNLAVDSSIIPQRNETKEATPRFRARSFGELREIERGPNIAVKTLLGSSLFGRPYEQGHPACLLHSSSVSPHSCIVEMFSSMLFSLAAHQ